MKKFFILIVISTIGYIGYTQSGGPEGKVSAKTETQEQAKVKVFPNPASNVVNILGLKNTSQANISVLDIYGNTLLSFKWTIRRNAINIPISNLEAGAYIILIHSEEQQIRTKFYKK